ncbi:hypothetical protein BQ8482_400010 [Mesorhizobium delmotii]|uniref:Uncharacterized protein n=1 Tax=Mesorhizobium delmotii TaxID=1631247 RepID=A0A2P9AT02_9HYPH|nr:hypothetical protein BQ8482_400010 [Mesorhizobium delmotii]
MRTPATRIFAWFRKTRLLKSKAQSPHEQRSQRDDKWNGTLVNSPIFCGAPAVSMAMQHKGRSFAAGQGSDLNDFQPDRRGRDVRREFGPSLRYSPGLVPGRPKGRHLRGIGPTRPDVGCAGGPEAGVSESRNRLLRTSTEIEENEMSHAAPGPAGNKDGEVLARPFVKCLLRLIRAQDFHGSCQGQSDTQLLAEFIITKDDRRDPHDHRSQSGRAVEARHVLHGRGGLPSRSAPA